MKRPLVLLAFLVCLCLSSLAQEKGTWRAQSKTARSITGDIAFAGEKFSINFSTYPVAEIRALTPAELASLAGDDAAPATAGTLYRLSIPGNKRFLNKNTLCSADEAQWLATAVSGKTLQMAVFSGNAMPVLTREALATTSDLCGTFTYTR